MRSAACSMRAPAVQRLGKVRQQWAGHSAALPQAVAEDDERKAAEAAAAAKKGKKGKKK